MGIIIPMERIRKRMEKKEYIEREAALRVLCDACGNAACPKGLIPQCSYYEKMQSIPAADVRPVVLCRDCKNSDTFASDCTEATFPLKCLSIRYGGVYPNWFCEHGEKKEES